MEDIKAYIESGILELYVIGDLNPEERAGVESMAALYPEVKAELAEIEGVMGALADSYAVEPAATSKEAFLSKLSFSDEQATEANTIATAPVIDEAPQGKVIAMNSSKLAFYKYSFAACFTLLLLSLGALFVLYQNLQNSKLQLAQLQTANERYANQVNYLDQEVEKSNEALNIYTNPDFKMVALKGTANSPASKLMIAFNAKEQQVMIDLKSMDMPAHDENHQYQLWALVDGKPVDLGLIDAEGKNSSRLLKMKEISNAQAFAVTLEPKGGSVNPTMDKLMVMGAI